MGKKKNDEKNQNTPILSIINFQFQASMLMAGKNNTLSAHYGQICKRINVKARQRMSCDIKRNLCRRCNLAIKPGITAELLIESVPMNVVGDDGKTENDTTEAKDINNIVKKRKRIRRGKKSKKNNILENKELTEMASTKQQQDQQEPVIRKQEKQQKIEPMSIQTSSSTTATTTTIDEHKHMLVQCAVCGYQKRYRINSNYKLWNENKEFVDTRNTRNIFEYNNLL